MIVVGSFQKLFSGDIKFYSKKGKEKNHGTLCRNLVSIGV